MRHHRTTIIYGAIALSSAIVVGAGTAASAASPWGTTTRSSTTATVMPAARLQSAAVSATVHTTTALVNGKSESILVDAKGLPLYYHQGDTAKKSQVSGELARLWPALTSSVPTGTGTSGKLTVVKGANGDEVAYNGRFLYTFVDDTSGHVTGQGVKDFFVATPHLKSISRSTATTKTTGSGSGGYGY